MLKNVIVLPIVSCSQYFLPNVAFFITAAILALYLTAFLALRIIEHSVRLAIQSSATHIKLLTQHQQEIIHANNQSALVHCMQPIYRGQSAIIKGYGSG